MSTDHHNPHAFGAALTAVEMNAPLGQLDAAIETVIATGSGASTSLTAQASAGQATLVVASSAGFVVGDPIYIGTGATFESRIIATVPDATHITVTVNLTSTYAAAKPVSKSPVEIVDARAGYGTLGARLATFTGDTVLDIRSYGASAASADNAVAIQAALDYQKANGGIVYIPAGTFLTSPLTYAASGGGQALHILGAGRDVSILKPKAGTGTVLTLSGPLTGCRFMDFRIDGTGGTGHGLYYSGTGSPNWLYKSTFENLDVRSCALVGLYIKSSFANRYVNITAYDNGQDQIKVWGVVTDYYERIDIHTTVTNFAGIRSIYGGTFVACNGIYDTAAAAGALFKFGGDGTAESDGLTAYPRVGIVGSNVEAFTALGVEFVNRHTACRMENVTFQTGTAGTAIAILEAVASTQPLVLEGCTFTLDGTTTWEDGYAIHTGSPVLTAGSIVGQTAAYDDALAIAYPISGTGAASVAELRALGVQLYYRKAGLAIVPLSYWRLGESSGTVAADEMGALAGTYVGTPTLGVAGLLADDSDTAVTLNGTSQSVTLSAAQIIQGLPAYSVAIWVNFPSLAVDFKPLYCERDQSTGTHYFVITVRTTTGRPYVTVKDGTTLDQIASPAGTFVGNGPHLFVVTKVGSTLTIYTDGVVNGSQTLVGGDVPVACKSEVGKNTWDGTYLPVTVDELLVCDRALSPTEVATLYAVGVAP